MKKRLRKKLEKKIRLKTEAILAALRADGALERLAEALAAPLRIRLVVLDPAPDRLPIYDLDMPKEMPIILKGDDQDWFPPVPPPTDPWKQS